MLYNTLVGIGYSLNDVKNMTFEDALMCVAAKKVEESMKNKAMQQAQGGGVNFAY